MTETKYPLHEMQEDGTWKTIAHVTAAEAQSMVAEHERMESIQSRLAMATGDWSIILHGQQQSMVREIIEAAGGDPDAPPN